ncbi:unnamed protein product [Rotaria magnacalcarata]|uniref:Uncharacterized protein n=3 Tax=Rotaria magnacalcarata TaxID=392030 RepID=A0A816L8H4_9BILA|nr:unnamed protein product [Rotaria magnacalcarata]CAF1318924.1 unnamed protein product [Rotaria magnacalcarata]CAF1922009.1 unnamed protein product [Rotaria magnacalcarata]CAF1933138.1 unnamed protein product [Rotaria magnacalcarata]CAF1937944.1 unnamed protein product [Rotaria magnacalcarata]
MATTTCGYEPIRSGDVILFYINRDGLPLSDRCTDRMWTFCMEQYPKNALQIKSIRDRVSEYPSIAYGDPPYNVAPNPRLTVQEKLQQIQTYVQRLEYNYTGMQFFDLNANRPISGLMDTARHIMTESLPIKCFEAFLIAIYLTTGIIGLERFNISFKTRFNSIVYRHIVLGVKYGQIYGGLGLSRRTDLAYKPLNGKYERLSTLIDDYVQAYKNYGHTVLRIRIGLPIIHDLKSYLTINWNAITIHPNKTDRIDYERELDKIVRVWRQMSIYASYRSNVSLASVVQPTGNIVTAASLPNRLQSLSFRSNREASFNCRRSAVKKTATTTDDSHATDRDQSLPCAIRV